MKCLPQSCLRNSELRLPKRGTVLLLLTILRAHRFNHGFAELGCQAQLYDYGIEENIFIYVSGEGDMSPLLDTDKPVIVTPGWYKMLEKPGKWYLDGSYPEREWSFEFEPIDFEDISDFEIFKNCTAKYDSENEYENAPAMASIFADCFDIYSEPIHEKGLYLFKDGAWKRALNSKFISVPSRIELCFAAGDGQTAMVEDNTVIFNDSGNYIYTGMHLRDLYINPKPPEYMWLSDCRIKPLSVTPILQQAQSFLIRKPAKALM